MHLRHLDKDTLPLEHKHRQILRHTSFTGHTSLEFCHLNAKIGKNTWYPQKIRSLARVTSLVLSSKDIWKMSNQKLRDRITSHRPDFTRSECSTWVCIFLNNYLSCLSCSYYTDAHWKTLVRTLLFSEWDLQLQFLGIFMNLNANQCCNSSRKSTLSLLMWFFDRNFT